MNGLTFSIRRLLLTIFATLLGSIPIVAALLAARWNSIEFFNMDKPLSEAELSILVAFVFVSLTLCSGFVLECLGHAMGYREHGYQVFNILVLILFALVSLALVFNAIMAGALFQDQMGMYRGNPSQIFRDGNPKPLEDIRNFGITSVFTVGFADLLLARTVWRARQRSEYMHHLETTLRPT